MSWQPTVIVLLALVLISGVVWFERSRPSARIVAAVAAMAALGVAGRVMLAPLPNVVATTDVALLAGYTLGGPPGFAVGALSALISNFWLGQGPWTPWQMAGWGMVGIGGAALAASTGRRLGRWSLAAAAALAGLLYGALLDLSAMVNFGGEQSLDRYLALSARAIPFNIMHAMGNAAIMLAAGPALVRMLRRYRERFEVRWSPASATAVCALLALALAAFALPERAVAGAGDGASWLRKAQNRDGGFGTSAGSSSSPGMTQWAVLGLEAAGRNPRDVRKGGRSPFDYLRSNVGEITSTGDLELTIMGLRGAGLSPKRFGGRNLIGELRSREKGNGSYNKQVNLTAYAVLARKASGEGPEGLARSAKWLRRAQNRDGGWGSTKRAASEPDSTGAALQALDAAKQGSSDQRRGAAWLRGAQHRDGGWSLSPGARSNSQSTAWALQGLIAAQAGPKRVRKGPNNGFEFLRKRQRAGGYYAYSRDSDQTPVWVTAQVLTALEREPFPIPAVARNTTSDGGSGNGSGGSSGSGSSGGGFGSGSSGFSGSTYDGSGFGRGGFGGAGGSGFGAGGNAGAGGFGKGAGGGTGKGGGVGGQNGQGGGALESIPLAVDDGPFIPGGGDNEMPSTPVLLGILALIGAALGGGWLYYRDRLP